MDRRKEMLFGLLVGFGLILSVFVLTNRYWSEKFNSVKDELKKTQHTVNTLEACPGPDPTYTELESKLERCATELEKRTLTICGDYTCGDLLWFIGYGGVNSGRVVLYSDLNEVKEGEVGEYWLVEEKHYFADGYFGPDWILPPSSIFHTKEELILHIKSL